MASTHNWATAYAARVGPAIAHRRTQLGITAADLVTRCANHGVTITRAAVSRLENGKRGVVTVDLLAALAAALDTSPLALLFPLDGNPVDVVADHPLEPWQARRWWTGEDEPLTRLHRDHDHLLNQLTTAHTRRANYTAAVDDSARRHPAQQDAPYGMWAESETRHIIQLEQVIARTRRDITNLGATPPQLPAEHNHIDTTDYSLLPGPHLTEGVE